MNVVRVAYAGFVGGSETSTFEMSSVVEGGCVRRGVQWNSPKNGAKAGGVSGWSPQPMAATTGANYRPMVSGRRGR